MAVKDTLPLMKDATAIIGGSTLTSNNPKDAIINALAMVLVRVIIEVIPRLWQRKKKEQYDN